VRSGQHQDQRGNRRAMRHSYFPAFAFRRSAQYFRIRSDTSLRLAADMLRLRRRLPDDAVEAGAACARRPTAEELGKLLANRRLFLLQLFEPRHRAEPCQSS
jgi:hypothetical protein